MFYQDFDGTTIVPLTNCCSSNSIFIILASGVLIAIRETLKDKPLSLKKIVDRR